MKKANQFKSLQILHTAMLLGMVLFCMVSAVTHSTGKAAAANASLNKILQVAVLLVSFACVRGGFYIFSKRLQSIDPMVAANEKMSVYRTAAIIKWALIEGPVLFAVVSFMVTGNYAFIALAFALIILFAFQGPLKTKIMIQLRLTQQEADGLEGSK